MEQAQEQVSNEKEERKRQQRHSPGCGCPPWRSAEPTTQIEKETETRKRKRRRKREGKRDDFQERRVVGERGKKKTPLAFDL